MSCRLNSACDCIQVLRSVVEVMGARAGLDSVQINRLALAVDELFANIGKHGYQEDEGEVEMRADITDGELHFEFRDHARPIEDNACLQGHDICGEHHPLLPGGLGLHLIHAVMDDVRHEPLRNGNRWVLIKKLT